MTLSATFGADFSSFQDAVKNCVVSLDSFESKSERVEAKLTRMSNSFSGVKVLQDVTLMAEGIERAGGVATLTEKQLQSMGAKAAEALELAAAKGVTLPANVLALAEASQKATEAHRQQAAAAAEVASAEKLASAEAAKTAAAYSSMVSGFKGETVIAQAQQMAKAIQEAGGVARLTSNDLQQAGRVADEAAQHFRKMGQEVPADIREISEAAKKAQVDTTAMSVAIGTLAADALKRGASAAVDFGNEALTIAARAETLRVSAQFLGKQQGLTADQVDALARALNKQGITTTQSYDTIVQLSRANLGLADSLKLASTAQDVARLTGRNSSEVLGDLIHGVQTLQVETLRNAGVVIQLDQEYVKFAATNHRTVESLSAQEKQQIALAAVLREGERVVGAYGVTNGTVGGQVQSLKRYQEEAARSMGEDFLGAYKLGTGALTEFYKVIREHPAAFNAAGVAIAGASTALFGLKAASDLGFIGADRLSGVLPLLGKGLVAVPVAMAGWEFGTWLGKVTGLSDGIEKLSLRVQGFTSDQIDSYMAMRKWSESADGQAATAAQQKKALAELEEQARKTTAAQQEKAKKDAEALEESKRQTSELQKQKDAIRTIATFTEDWGATLRTVTPAVTEHAKALLYAGASAEDVRRALELSEGQMRAITKAREADISAAKRQQEAAQQWVAADKQSMDLARKNWDEYASLVAARTGTLTDQKIAAVDRALAAEIAAYKASDAYIKSDQQARLDAISSIEAKAREQRVALSADWAAITSELSTNSQAGLQQAADFAKNTYEIALKSYGQIKDSKIEELRVAWMKAQDAASSWSAGTVAGIDSVARKLDDATNSVTRMSLTWSQAMDLVRQGMGTMTGTVTNSDFSASNRAQIQRAYDEHRYFGPVKNGAPDFESLGFSQVPWMASGGPVEAGKPVVVGDGGGPELFVPPTNGTILPAGSFSGGMRVTVNVNGGFATAEAIGRKVRSSINDLKLSLGYRQEIFV